MKTVTKTAIANMKYRKSKNILTGIAVFLTSILLFLVPAIGFINLDIQMETIKRTYPTWHALFRSVDADTAAGLMAHHDIETGGLRSDVGVLYHKNADITVSSMDSKALELTRGELSEGTFPKKEDDLAASKGMLKEFGISADIGDKVTLPFQRSLKDGIDFAEEKEFTICGFVPDHELNLKNHTYMALVSDKFLKHEIPKKEIRYRFLFRIPGADGQTTDMVEEQITAIGRSFHIPESDTHINTDYLLANLKDPSFFLAIAVIMLIVTAAGMITIYSIYYVSMAQQVQEFGRLKAIGASKRQIRQILLREGLCTACLAVPLGLLLSTLLVRPILNIFIEVTAKTRDPSALQIYQDIIDSRAVELYRLELYLFAAAAAFFTVYLSLLVPMRKAQNISPVEAMRYQGSSISLASRKGYTELTVGRLAKTYLMEYKKRSVLTILSMSVTGILVITISTILSCAVPERSADMEFYGRYQLELNEESGNKEHPEREWNSLIADNPLSEELKYEIEHLSGVEKVVDFSWLKIRTDLENGDDIGINGLLGLPKSCFPELKQGITQGDASWEDLLSGDKIILSETALKWLPGLSVGDTVQIKTSNGSQTVTRNLEIIAIGSYPFGLTGHDYLLMSKDAAEQIFPENCAGYFHIFADKKYDQTLENSLKSLIENPDLLILDTWKNSYDRWKSTMAVVRGVSIAFLAILGIICIMNLINTMLNNIHIRKKEFGIIQAIGMTGRQLSKMLQIEGLFYTFGTLFLSVGLGSILGYGVFLWAKSRGIFNITVYYYPAGAVAAVTAVLIFVQLILTALLGRSVKKESLIERIRCL